MSSKCGSSRRRIAAAIAVIRILVLTCAAALACANAQPADAAMCIRLSTEPTRPEAGATATIVLRTFIPLANGELEPWEVRDYPFRVQAVSPAGRVYRVAMEPSQSDPYAWAGSFRFPRRGTWTIRVTNFAPSYPKACGAVLRVRVRPRDA